MGARIEMIGKFERYVSIVWAGRRTEDRCVSLRVVEANPENMDGAVVNPPNAQERRDGLDEGRIPGVAGPSPQIK